MRSSGLIRAGPGPPLNRPELPTLCHGHPARNTDKTKLTLPLKTIFNSLHFLSFISSWANNQCWQYRTKNSSPWTNLSDISSCLSDLTPWYHSPKISRFWLYRHNLYEARDLYVMIRLRILSSEARGGKDEIDQPITWSEARDHNSRLLEQLP